MLSLLSEPQDKIVSTEWECLLQTDTDSEREQQLQPPQCENDDCLSHSLPHPPQSEVSTPTSASASASPPHSASVSESSFSSAPALSASKSCTSSSVELQYDHKQQTNDVTESQQPQQPSSPPSINTRQPSNADEDTPTTTTPNICTATITISVDDPIHQQTTDDSEMHAMQPQIQQENNDSNSTHHTDTAIQIADGESVKHNQQHKHKHKHHHRHHRHRTKHTDAPSQPQSPYHCSYCGGNLRYGCWNSCRLIRMLTIIDQQTSYKIHQLSCGVIDYLFVFGAFVFGSKFMPITILISIFIVNISGFLFVGISCTCTVLITQFMKKLIGRQRPDPKTLAVKILDFRTRLTNYAFPSGDTAQVNYIKKNIALHDTISFFF